MGIVVFEVNKKMIKNNLIENILCIVFFYKGVVYRVIVYYKYKFLKEKKFHLLIVLW